MANKLDLKGQQFGTLTVLERSENKGKNTYWLCQCECGNEKAVSTGNLRRGDVRSCGCRREELCVQKKLSNMIGRRFGRLIVISRAKDNKEGRPQWNCLCDCGNYCVVPSQSRIVFRKSNCGCRPAISSGSEHPCWKGGRHKQKSGYVVVYCPELKDKGKKPYILEHRQVMEKKLGRPLNSNENVHHINGNKSDNRLENLELWVENQPSGQRVEDLVTFALEILSIYSPEKLRQI